MEKWEEKKSYKHVAREELEKGWSKSNGVKLWREHP